MSAVHRERVGCEHVDPHNLVANRRNDLYCCPLVCPDRSRIDNLRESLHVSIVTLINYICKNYLIKKFLKTNLKMFYEVKFYL